MALQKPIIFNKKEDIPLNTKLIEALDGSIKELFFIENPKLKKGTPEIDLLFKKFVLKLKIKGIWVYYPWQNKAILTLPEKLYLKLRTSRNRDIITEEEQINYRDTKVGIAGLSVGSGILSALTISGGPKVLKIADFDVVEVSNLNRIRAKLLDAGSNKTHVAAREVWELDPFANLYLWDKGLAEDTLSEFIIGKPRLDVFVEQMDSLDLKIMTRIICRRYKIPVIMATDNGDGIILDVERFDLEPKRQLFHGLIGKIQPKDLKNLDFKKWLSMATKIVGPEYLTERMQESLLEIGKNISAVPQLGTSATMAGSAVAYVIRRLANNQPMPSGRYIVSLEEKLIRDYNSPKSVATRKIRTEEFRNKFSKF